MARVFAASRWTPSNRRRFGNGTGIEETAAFQISKIGVKRCEHPRFLDPPSNMAAKSGSAVSQSAVGATMSTSGDASPIG